MLDERPESPSLGLRPLSRVRLDELLQEMLDRVGEVVTSRERLRALLDGTARGPGQVKIQVLGLGCPKCDRLAWRAEEAARRLGLDYELEKVRDLGRIVDAGAAVPALVVDGVVRSAGKVPSRAEIEEFLTGCGARTAP